VLDLAGRTGITIKGSQNRGRPVEEADEGSRSSVGVGRGGGEKRIAIKGQRRGRGRTHE
jgi:hypothetical protein